MSLNDAPSRPDDTSKASESGLAAATPATIIVAAATAQGRVLASTSGVETRAARDAGIDTPAPIVVIVSLRMPHAGMS